MLLLTIALTGFVLVNALAWMLHVDDKVAGPERARRRAELECRIDAAEAEADALARREEQEAEERLADRIAVRVLARMAELR